MVGDGFRFQQAKRLEEYLDRGSGRKDGKLTACQWHDPVLVHLRDVLSNLTNRSKISTSKRFFEPCPRGVGPCALGVHLETFNNKSDTCSRQQQRSPRIQHRLPSPKSGRTWRIMLAKSKRCKFRGVWKDPPLLVLLPVFSSISIACAISNRGLGRGLGTRRMSGCWRSWTVKIHSVSLVFMHDSRPHILNSRLCLHPSAMKVQTAAEAINRVCLLVWGSG